MRKPLTFRAIVAWHESLKNGKILLRDVIDLEATQGMGNPPAEGESDEPDPSPPAFDAVDDSDEEESEGSSLSLSALEEKLKPDTLATFEEIEASTRSCTRCSTSGWSRSPAARR